MDIQLDSKAIFATSFQALAEINYDKMFAIASEANKNNDILKWFDENWEDAVRRVSDFVPPRGFHMHLVDANNKYHPEEDSAQQQLSEADGDWTRIEVRTGHAKIACIVCFWCKSKRM